MNTTNERYKLNKELAQMFKRRRYYGRHHTGTGKDR